MELMDMESKVSKALGFLTCSPIVKPVSVELEDGKYVVRCRDRVIEVQEEALTEELADKWADMLWPESRERLLGQIYGWEGREAIYEQIKRDILGGHRVKGMVILDNRNAIEFEMEDNSKCVCFEHDTLAGLARYLTGKTPAQIAGDFDKAYRGQTEERTATKHKGPIDRLVEQWAGAAERADRKLEDGQAGILVDESARKVFVLVSDEVVGEIECPADTDFNMWLDNSRNFGKSLRNIADTKLESNVEQGIHINQQWKTLVAKSSLPLCKLNTCNVELFEGINQVQLWWDGKPVSVIVNKTEREFDEWVRSGQVFGKRMSFIIKGLIEAMPKEEVVQIEEEVDMLGEANRCLKVSMEEHGIDCDVKVEYHPDTEQLIYKVGHMVFNATRISPDKLGNTARLMQASEICIRGINQHKKAEQKKADLEAVIDKPENMTTLQLMDVGHQLVAQLKAGVPNLEARGFVREEAVILAEKELAIEMVEVEEAIKVEPYTEAEMLTIRRKATSRMFTALAKYGPDITSNEFSIKVSKNLIGHNWVVFLTDGGNEGEYYAELFSCLCIQQAHKWLTDTKGSGKVIRAAIKHLNNGGDDSSINGVNFADGKDVPFEFDNGVVSQGTGIFTKAEAAAAERIADEHYIHCDLDWERVALTKKLNDRVAKRLLKKAKADMVIIESFEKAGEAGFPDTYNQFEARIVDGEVEFTWIPQYRTVFDSRTTEAGCRAVGGEELVAEYRLWLDAQIVKAQDGPNPF
ncbi:MAG: hypothetical protein ACRCUJ_12960 [Phocaeicola sp.]